MSPRDEARLLLADALNLAVSDLDEDPSPANTPSWESLAHLRLVLAIEERRGRPLDAGQIFELDSLNAVADLLDSEAGDRD